MTLLDKDLIAQPQLWSLVLMPGDERLDVALIPPVADEEMIWRTFAFDSATPDRRKALEDVIYENPLLLCDFKRVYCIADCGSFMALPAELDGDAVLEMGRSVLGPECESSHLLTEGCGAENAIMTQWIDEDTYAFLCRTFFNIRFYWRMGRLVEYLMSLPAHEAGAASAYALLRGKELTVVIVNGGKLLCANYFRCRGGYDAAYYILSALQTLGLDLASTRICAGGDGFAALAEELGRFAPHVSRLEPPALPYRTGRTTLDAPFDLLIFKPCE